MIQAVLIDLHVRGGRGISIDAQKALNADKFKTKKFGDDEGLPGARGGCTLRLELRFVIVMSGSRHNYRP